jgi:hypothetical protein
MIIRGCGAEFKRKVATFPIVTVLGPRQCGKTTFVRSTLPDWTYFDLEKPSDLTPFLEDPEDRLRRVGNRVVLDEAQQAPKLFPLLRGLVDERRKHNARYVLLGSASPSLIRQISESLAGRSAFLEMTPFHWSEIHPQMPSATLEDLWFRGGFPDAFLTNDDVARLDWMEAYTKTFLERDLAALGIDVSAPMMRKFWTLLAHHHKGLWNASELAGALGLNYHTVNRYADILEQTFLIRKLPPYFANVGKRLVKRPKVYFRDTGLLHYFLGIQRKNILETHPARGGSWEGFLLEQIITALSRQDPGSQAYFWRTAAGAEVDLLMVAGGRPIPFEIKLHSSPQRNDVRGLVACLLDLKLDRGYVVYPGEKSYSLGESITTLPAQELLSGKVLLSSL